MSFRLEYASSRGEVWRWYWRSWRRRLWKAHLAVVLVTAVWSYVAASRGGAGAKAAMAVAGVGLFALAAMAFYPQVMFKSKTRVLVVGDEGVETWIGKRHRRYGWSDFQPATDEDGAVVLSLKNANAFIIPGRAFDTPATREAFLAFLRRMTGAAA